MHPCNMSNIVFAERPFLLLYSKKSLLEATEGCKARQPEELQVPDVVDAAVTLKASHKHMGDRDADSKVARQLRLGQGTG